MLPYFCILKEIKTRLENVTVQMPDRAKNDFFFFLIIFKLFIKLIFSSF
jgi:hypothetical protein